MDADGVVALYGPCLGEGVAVGIDGGWGVDAPPAVDPDRHEDLDVAVQERDVPKLRGALEGRGYLEVRPETARPHNFVLGDRRGREVDVHVVVLDADGDGVYGPPGDGEAYPAASLTGTGAIGGAPVRCVSPEWLVEFHRGYEPAEGDVGDVSALRAAFGLELPAECRPFADRGAKLPDE